MPRPSAQNSPPRIQKRTITVVSGAQPQAGPLSDQDVVSAYFRIQRNFLY